MADTAHFAFPSTWAKGAASLMRQTRFYVLFALVVATAAPMSFGASASAAGAQVVINFDDLSDGVVVTNQYPSATFSSTSGNVNYVSTQPSYNGSKPNFICTGGVGGGIDCGEPTIIDFTSPINGLTFNGMGINDTGHVADIDVFGASGLLATVPVIGHAGGLDPELQNLSSYANVTRIRIYNINDGGGIGWDDFTFTQGGSTLTTSIVDTPDPVTAGGNVRYTVKVKNTDSESSVSAVQVTDTMPAGTTFVSSSAGCTHTSTTVTCSLGIINAGLTKSVFVDVHTSPGSGGTNITDSATTSPGGSTASATTHVNAPNGTGVSGHVEPGGSITTGGNNPATLLLPGTGPGADVTLTLLNGAHFCAGPCTDPATQINNFPGYTNPNQPIILRLTLSHPSLAAAQSDLNNSKVYKLYDDPSSPLFNTVIVVPNCTQSGIASPTPCVNRRFITQRPPNWQTTFEILYLSGDGKMGRH